MWVAAAAKAATEVLLGKPFTKDQLLILPEHDELVSVSVQSAACLSGGQKAIAITHCCSSLGLDLTRGMEIWTCVQMQELHGDLSCSANGWLKLVPGMGVGTLGEEGDICISRFAYDLLIKNLEPLLPKNICLELEIVFPKGKDLSLRTSNASFGVVDGLALIGTQAEPQESASPDQLVKSLEELRTCSNKNDFDGFISLVIGENGLNLAKQFGLNSRPIIKIGNWVGPLLVAAAEAGIKKLLLLGYHGKLVKLAGGIFHTHHHLADARLEILIAIAVKEGLPLSLIKILSSTDSMNSAFLCLNAQNPGLAKKLWLRLARTVEVRSSLYVSRYGEWDMQIGSVLFDRQRRLRWAGPLGVRYLSFFGVTLEDS